MSLLLAAPGRDTGHLLAAIRERNPALDVRIWPETGAVDDIRFAVLWQQPPGLLRQLRNLKAVCSLGAGVEHVLADPDLPEHLPVGRLAGRRLAADMAGYLVAQVIGHWRRFPNLHQQQVLGQWKPWAPPRPPQVGIMGIGAMGKASIEAFQVLEVPVRGFSRSGRGPADLLVEHGMDGLARLGEWSDYLICLLPLTVQTRGILNAELFARMRPGSVLINVGRGAHLVEGDLIEGLSRGRPAAAILDVFDEEPLPANHPFWTHPAVSITPHCASITCDEEAADLIVESYRRVIAGQLPLGLVDRTHGY